MMERFVTHTRAPGIWLQHVSFISTSHFFILLFNKLRDTRKEKKRKTRNRKWKRKNKNLLSTADWCEDPVKRVPIERLQLDGDNLFSIEDYSREDSNRIQEIKIYNWLKRKRKGDGRGNRL